MANTSAKITINDARWHARLATLLSASGKYEKAATHYRRALCDVEDVVDENRENVAIIQQEQLQWQFDLAATEIKRGHRHEAITLYESILKAYPECVEVLVNLAVQLTIADASRLEEALELCMRALALRPDFAEAHYNRNVLLRRLERQHEAISVYRRYIAGDIVRKHGSDAIAGCHLPWDGLSQVLSADKITFACDKESANNRLAIVCVKWGTKYGAEYVNRLYNSVSRHSEELPFTFVCLTDSADGINFHANLMILPLEGYWRGWWNKSELFSTSTWKKLRSLGHSRCLYIDLDSVIVGDITTLIRWSPPFGVLALLQTDQMVNERRKGGFNSSIMMWRIDEDKGASQLLFAFSFLHTHFDIVNRYIYKFDHWLEMACLATCYLEDTFPGQIIEYCSLDNRAATLPQTATIVCFPLNPKPHNAVAPWISQHWV